MGQLPRLASLYRPHRPELSCRLLEPLTPPRIGDIGGEVDFIAEPLNDAEEALVYASYARLFDLGWDAGDDVDRYPSYGPYWQTLDRPWTTPLGALGVYGLAARHAAAVRARKRRG